MANSENPSGLPTREREEIILVSYDTDEIENWDPSQPNRRVTIRHEQG